MANKFTVAPFGPFSKGTVVTANPSEGLEGALREVQYMHFTGEDRFTVSSGVSVEFALMDDQATAAPVTSVIAIDKFFDGAFALAWSSVTQKVYLYNFPANFSGYYNWNGSLITDVTVAYPIYVVWGPGADDHSKTTAVTGQPDVSTTELLGQLVIAHTQAQDQNGLYFPTRLWNKQTGSPFTSPSQTALSYLPSFLCNGTNNSPGTDVAYFLFVIAFAQAIWGGGYADGSTAGYSTGVGSGLAFDPCLWKFSPPYNPVGMQIDDSITIGNRLRSNRERIIGAGLAGDCLILGASYLTAQVTGYGKDSYYKKVIDTTYGFIGPKCMVSVGNDLYYWTSRGPMRIKGALGQYAIYQVQPPEPLWDRVYGTIPTVANPSRIVAGFDADRDQVIWVYDSSQGVRTVMAYDIRRDVFRTAAEDLGVVIQSAGVVEPVIASTNTSPQGPTTDPIIISTGNITPTGATATFEELDPNAATEISLSIGTPRNPSGIGQPITYAFLTWTVTAVVPAIGGISAKFQTYQFTNLSAGTHYAWRIRGFRNGQYTDYVGPATSTSEFVTPAMSSTTEPAPIGPSAVGISTDTNGNLAVQWGIADSFANTEVWLAAPSILFNALLITPGIGGISQAQIPTVAALLTTLPPGSASTFWNVSTTGGTYGVWVRHVRSGFQPSPWVCIGTPVVGSSPPTYTPTTVYIPPVEGSISTTGTQALPMSSFYNTIGIFAKLAAEEIANNTTNVANIKHAITDIGFQHVRDGGTNTAFLADVVSLGSANNVRWSLIIDGAAGGGVPDPTQLTTLFSPAVAAVVEQWESQNEPDESMVVKSGQPNPFTYKTQLFPLGPIEYGNDLYTTVKGAPAAYQKPVASFSLANPGPTEVGLLNGTAVPVQADLGNMHNYPGSPNNASATPPTPEVWNLPGDQLTTGRNWTGTTLSLSGLAGKPLVTTETGFSVQASPGTTGGDINGLPQIAQAKYMLRTYAKQFQYNVTKAPSSIVRTYYTCIGISQVNKYSIINTDGSYRIAAGAVKSLLYTASDISFSPGKLNYTINSTDPNWTQYGNQILFQKSNGNFIIMAWLDTASFASGNPAATPVVVSTDISKTATITISFGGVKHQQINLYDHVTNAEHSQLGVSQILGTNVSTITTTVNDGLQFFEVVG